MWRQIRGMGLSYNYRMICRPDNGHLYFQLFKSSQLIQAYRVAKEIMVSKCDRPVVEITSCNPVNYWIPVSGTLRKGFQG